jgi:hypothetical protein
MSFQPPDVPTTILAQMPPLHKLADNIVDNNVDHTARCLASVLRDEGHTSALISEGFRGVAAMENVND